MQHQVKDAVGAPDVGEQQRAAISTATAASSTATRTMGFRRVAPNSRPAEATMSPPAERPTKYMKSVMYNPDIMGLRMLVTARPLLSW